MEKIYVLSFRYTEEGAWDENDEKHIDIIAVSSSIEALRHRVYDWFRDYRFNIPDDDEGAEKWLEENEGIGGWWDDTRTNFHFNDDERDFWIEEVEFLK
jgi:hypothetical protein